MLYKVLVVLHLLGGATWVGGHLALIAAVLPAAILKRDVTSVVDFEQGYGRIGLLALLVQVITGTWLASIWLGGWSNIFSPEVPAAHMVLLKLGLLIATFALAGHAYHRILPRLRQEAAGDSPSEPSALGSFALHARITTAIAVLMLIVGAAIRLGGLL